MDGFEFVLWVNERVRANILVLVFPELIHFLHKKLTKCLEVLCGNNGTGGNHYVESQVDEFRSPDVDIFCSPPELLYKRKVVAIHES